MSASSGSASVNPLPISGVQTFDTIGWAVGGSDDPNPHQYIFYKYPEADIIRILESTDLPGYDDWTEWKICKNVITPSGTIKFSKTTQIAAASTYGLGYSGSKKEIRVFVYCEDGRIRDYVWYPGALGWKQGDLSRQARIGAKFAAQGYDYAGVACFSLFYQDNEGWVHECRKYGEDEWHFQTVGEMSGNSPGLWLKIWEQDGVLNKRVVSQNLAIDAQLRDYTYDPSLYIWKRTAEHHAGVPNHIPEVFSDSITITGLIVNSNPNDERVFFNRGDHNIIQRMRANGAWAWGPSKYATDAQPFTPVSSVYIAKTTNSVFQQWMNIFYINQDGNLARSEYRSLKDRSQKLMGGSIQV